MVQEKGTGLSQGLIFSGRLRTRARAPKKGNGGFNTCGLTCYLCITLLMHLLGRGGGSGPKPAVVPFDLALRGGKGPMFRLCFICVWLWLRPGKVGWVLRSEWGIRIHRSAMVI